MIFAITMEMDVVKYRLAPDSEKFNRETLQAFQEAQDIADGKSKAHACSSFDEALDSITGTHSDLLE